MIRVGDRFTVTVGKKQTGQIWTVETMVDNERVKLWVEQNGKRLQAGKVEDLVTLMVWAHHGRRILKGSGVPLRRNTGVPVFRGPEYYLPQHPVQNIGNAKWRQEHGLRPHCRQCQPKQYKFCEACRTRLRESGKA